jgi:hypothetical protein
MRTPAAVAGLLGGLCWSGAYVLDATGGSGGLVDALTWAGLALLAIAVLGAGAGLVSRSATWLRVLVAVCFAALVWSVLELLRDSVDGLTVYAAFGVLAAVVSVVMMVRSRPAAPEPTGRRVGGSHAR